MVIRWFRLYLETGRKFFTQALQFAFINIQVKGMQNNSLAVECMQSKGYSRKNPSDLENLTGEIWLAYPFKYIYVCMHNSQH